MVHNKYVCFRFLLMISSALLIDFEDFMRVLQISQCTYLNVVAH